MFKDHRSLEVEVPAALRDSVALTSAMLYSDYGSADDILEGMDEQTAKYVATYLAAKLRDAFTSIGILTDQNEEELFQEWATAQAEFINEYEKKWDESITALRKQLGGNDE